MKQAILAIIFCLSATCLYAQTDIQYPEDFPDRGREVLQEQYAYAKITSVTGGGKAGFGDVYYVYGRMGEQKLELILTKEGEVSEEKIATEIPLHSVPEVCMAAAKEKIGNDVIVKAEKVVHNDIFEYRVTAKEMTEAERAQLDKMVAGALEDPPEGMGEQTSADVISQKVVLVSTDGEVLENFVRYHIRRTFAPAEEKK